MVKPLQGRKPTATVPLPFLGQSPLCLVSALQQMIEMYPAHPDNPLFVVPRMQDLILLIDSVARKHHRKISTKLQIQPHLTFHAFRRDGASWSFKQGGFLLSIL